MSKRIRSYFALKFLIGVLFVCIIFSVILAINGYFPLGKNGEEDFSGIALSFDDYFPDNWENYFDLFDKYNAKVTFFVNGNYVTQFMRNAQERGHEIGFHTIDHPYLPDLSKEDFILQTISIINPFKNEGIELVSFAYSFGAYSPWMHETLLEYYDIVRGFTGNVFYYNKNSMKHSFVDSISIDNVENKNSFVFKYRINKMFFNAKRTNKIVTITSHDFSSDDWGITPERLEYVLKKGKNYGLRFFRYKDL